MAKSTTPKKCPPIHDVDEDDDKKMPASQDPDNNCKDGLEKLSLELDNRYADLVRPIEGIEFVQYKDERQIDDIMKLVGRDLSEPYSSKRRLQIAGQFASCHYLFAARHSVAKLSLFVFHVSFCT
jgi:hypothetical protein